MACELRFEDFVQRCPTREEERAMAEKAKEKATKGGRAVEAIHGSFPLKKAYGPKDGRPL